MRPEELPCPQFVVRLGWPTHHGPLRLGLVTATLTTTSERHSSFTVRISDARVTLTLPRQIRDSRCDRRASVVAILSSIFGVV